LLDIGVKALLIGLLALAVVRPDLPQFDGKAMTGRALTYPIAALIVPVAWWFSSRSARATIRMRSTSCSCSRS
jgi:hypothetical protein